MSESEKFGNNPFASLTGKISPKDTAAPAAQAISKIAAKTSRPVQPKVATPSEDDGDDAAFFWQAMQSVQPKSKGKQPDRTDFALGERVEMPKVDTKKAPTTHAVAESDLPTPTKAQEKLPETSLNVEDAAFFKAMREVTALPGKGREIAPAVEPVAPLAQANTMLQDFLDGKLEFALSLTGEYLEGHVVGLDELTMNKLRAGQYSPEAHLDLHGLNAVQAYQALVGFFRGSWYKGLRSVLVVPGRGRNSTDGFSVLRDKLQLWLTQEPFKRVVLAFCTARPVDGGPGSVYVLLRKYRKKGKIYWERMPADPDLF